MTYSPVDEKAAGIIVHVGEDTSISMQLLALLMDYDIREAIHADAEFVDGDYQKFSDEYFARDPKLKQEILSGGHE